MEKIQVGEENWIKANFRLFTADNRVYTTFRVICVVQLDIFTFHSDRISGQKIVDFEAFHYVLRHDAEQNAVQLNARS